MIYTGKLLRAEIYDDHTKPYTNVKAVYEAHKDKYPGKLIVTNGHWYNTKLVTPCGNYKVNGTVLSKESWMDWGFGWDTGPIITMRSTIPVMVTDMSNDNYLSTLPLLVGGKKRDDVIKKQEPNVKVPTLRTWFGVDAKGKWTVEVTTTNYTLDGIVERMQSLGIVDGMVLDGSGSSQCYDGTTYQRGDGRDLYSFLLLWFAEDGGTGGDDTEDDKEEITTTTYKTGIDVSEWQKTIDWEAVKAAGIEFAMIRAGYGQNNIDPQFKHNISECNRLGIPCGVFWFSYAYTEAMAIREAEYALAAVEPYKLDYPIAFDYESDSVEYAKKNGIEPDKAHVTALAYAFCGRIEQAKYYAMIYTNPSYLSKYFDSYIPKNYDIWLAQWPSKPDPSSKPSQAGGIWQYTNSGSVDGISVRVDMDAAYYDYPSIIKANGLNQPAAAPEPEPVPEPDTESPAKSENELAREWVKAMGISDGENPDAACTRQQVWTMLYRALGI